MLQIHPVFLGMQGDCKVTAERMAHGKNGYKIKVRMPSFVLLLVTIWTFVGPREESMFLENAVSKYLLKRQGISFLYIFLMI
jgi:hypothetical protein